MKDWTAVVRELSKLQKQDTATESEVRHRCPLFGYESWYFPGYDIQRADGCCSELAILTRIVLPLSKSAGGALGIFAFTQAWIDYLHVATTIGQQERTIQHGNRVDNVSVSFQYQL